MTDTLREVSGTGGLGLRALEATYYTSEEILAEERERLFFKTWQYACHLSEIDEPGAYVAVDVLGQNVVVLRDAEGEIRAFANVCRHRGHKLLEGRGRQRVIVCPYHHWSYSLDGSLRNIRAVATSHAPELTEICLHDVRVDQMLGFVFVNLDRNAEPISEFWPGVEDHILQVDPNVPSYTLGTSPVVIRPIEVAANWKIQVDNYLECQHCRHGHVSFADMLDVSRQELTLGHNSAYVYIPSSGKADNLAYPLDPEHDAMDLHFWWLFPNTGFGVFAGPANLTLFQWYPIDAGSARRITAPLEVAEPTDPHMFERQEKRAVWGRDVLQPEDVSFMESAQVGMTQRSFDRGWYIVDWENQEYTEAMMRHFHELYLAHMGRPAQSAD